MSAEYTRVFVGFQSCPSSPLSRFVGNPLHIFFTIYVNMRSRLQYLKKKTKRWTQRKSIATKRFRSDFRNEYITRLPPPPLDDGFPDRHDCQQWFPLTVDGWCIVPSTRRLHPVIVEIRPLFEAIKYLVAPSVRRSTSRERYDIIIIIIIIVVVMTAVVAHQC